MNSVIANKITIFVQSERLALYNIMKILNLKYLCMIMLIALTGCGDDTQFRVTGTVDGLGTQNLRVIYYTNTGIKSITATAVDGKFNFIGNAPAETLVEIFTSDRVPLMRMAVKNGETVDVHIDRAKPYELTLKGNDVSERMASFMRDNSDALTNGDRIAVNKAVAEYILRNKKDLTSTLLLLTEFSTADNTREADSLLQLIDQDARPDFLIENITAGLAERDSIAETAKMLPLRLYTAADSITTYTPANSRYSLLVFTRNHNERPDSMRRKISELLDGMTADQLRIVDISVAADSTAWHSQTKIDTKSDGYLSAWMPGAIASLPMKQLSVTRTPYYIVVDSTGTQQYRGASLTDAGKVLAR